MLDYRSNEVFGVSTKILEPSYVDRGDLDQEIRKYLERNKHIALKGESKCGKSWLRQRNIPDAIVVQCRLKKNVEDLFAEALSQIGVVLRRETTLSGTVKVEASGNTELGIGVIGRIKARLGIEASASAQTTTIPIGEGVDSLRFFCEAINASERRLVIEDFHYLPPKERQAFATDLKAMWDYQCYVVIIGIWSQNNLLLHLNGDLAARVVELSIYWKNTELNEVLKRGSSHLNLEIETGVAKKLVQDSYGTVGIMQNLALSYLDEVGVSSTVKGEKVILGDANKYASVAMDYADQLNALYQTFAERVGKRARTRKNATGIYGHVLKVVTETDDEILEGGLATDVIFRAAHDRERRIQKANLRVILRNIDGLQVDEEGRGLVISFDEYKDEVTIVDKQFLFYRKYATVKWPWEQIIEDSSSDENFGKDDSSI
jgi:hypothetical protein